MILRVSVLPQDIRKARRKNGYQCPVSRAFDRLLTWDYLTWTTKRRVVIHGAGPSSQFQRPRKLEAILPKEAREFIKRFDRGEKVEPFEFDIKLPGIVELREE